VNLGKLEFTVTRQKRAATSGEIRQDTKNAILLKQRAILFSLTPDCVKGATRKLAAKMAITKETTYITQEVNIYRATKGVPPMRVSW
jgi:hypothetical protein